MEAVLPSLVNHFGAALSIFLMAMIVISTITINNILKSMELNKEVINKRVDDLEGKIVEYYCKKTDLLEHKNSCNKNEYLYQLVTSLDKKLVSEIDNLYKKLDSMADKFYTELKSMNEILFKIASNSTKRD